MAGKDKDTYFLFPLIFYIDKTGTDALQRFSLEPLMFTTSILKQNVRELASAWRHVGIVPPCPDPNSTAEEVMQHFHHCLDILLEELVYLQRDPPLVHLTINGETVSRRLLLPVAFVMGDQPSQDKHCGRKSANVVGAGRIHRQCMTSSIHAACTTLPCSPVAVRHIKVLSHLAVQSKAELISLVLDKLPDARKGERTPVEKKQKNTLMDHLKRRTKFARMVLETVYSMYPIRNAWSNVCFGSNEDGIYRATLDDPMHYSEAGLFLYLAQVSFVSMTTVERTTMEKKIRSRFEKKDLASKLTSPAESIQLASHARRNLLQMRKLV
jgi:hypothetical protein